MNALRRIALSAILAGSVAGIALAQTTPSGTTATSPEVGQPSGTVTMPRATPANPDGTPSSQTNGFSGSSGTDQSAPSAAGTTGMGQRNPNTSLGNGADMGAGSNSAHGGVPAAADTTNGTATGR